MDAESWGSMNQIFGAQQGAQHLCVNLKSVTENILGRSVVSMLGDPCGFDVGGVIQEKPSELLQVSTCEGLIN